MLHNYQYWVGPIRFNIKRSIPFLSPTSTNILRSNYVRFWLVSWFRRYCWNDFWFTFLNSFNLFLLLSFELYFNFSTSFKNSFIFWVKGGRLGIFLFFLGDTFLVDLTYFNLKVFHFIIYPSLINNRFSLIRLIEWYYAQWWVWHPYRFSFKRVLMLFYGGHFRIRFLRKRF